MNRIPNGTTLNASQYEGSSFEEDEESTGKVYKYLGLLCSLAMIGVSIVGAIGNGYAIWHFGRPSSRSSVNILLTAMSTFDLILLFTGAPIYSLLGIYSYTDRHIFLLALGYCTMFLYPFSHMAQGGSAWTMMLISFERYLAVCHPFIARRELTVERARICVVLVALLAIGYNVCRFWEYGMNSQGLPDPILRSDPIYVSVYFHWMYFAFIFSIPLLFIFVFNTLVAAGVRKATMNRPRCQMNAQQCTERKTTMMLLVVVAVFFACNSLAWLLNGYEMLGYESSEAAFEFLSDLNNLLILAHPAFNILVYARFSAKFRCEFWYCLCRYIHPPIITTPQSSITRGDLKVYPPNRHVSYSILDGRLSYDHGDQPIHCLRKHTMHTVDVSDHSGHSTRGPPVNGSVHESTNCGNNHLMTNLKYQETKIEGKFSKATAV